MLVVEIDRQRSTSNQPTNEPTTERANDRPVIELSIGTADQCFYNKKCLVLDHRNERSYETL